ncbi:MAG: hypothetical protein MUC65_06045, partial [Pontiellaceae bacterium]|nr:hypothetical protein [Pontiellaceae bacterium]
TKIITNNRYVERSPLFSDNYVVFADGDPDADAFVEAVWKKRSLAPQKTLRSIVDFIEELISER